MSLTRLMTFGSRKRTAVASAAFTMLFCFTTSGAAEYRVDVGDVLEVAVAGIPDLRQRVTVQLDGSISYPLLGTFAVSGLPLSEVRAKIREILPTKVFRQRTPEGRDNVVVIEPGQVTVNVVEYRPIYVNGDVSRPGEQTYRPFMTVRQAIALAGGYEIMRFRMTDPFLDSADFHSQYQSLWTDFAKEQAHIWRVKAELGEQDDPDQKSLREVPLPSSTSSQITRLEADELKTHQSDYSREKTFLQSSIKQADEQIGVLSVRLEKETAGVKDDNDELQRILQAYSKGAVAIPRITDARRALLLSATRQLQTMSEVMRAKRQRDEFSRQLERLDDQRRANLLQELQDAGVKLNQIKAQLQAVGEKIEYTALVRSQLVRGAGGKPEITVVRKGEKGREQFVADADSELQPGDVVEVALQSEQGVSIPVQ